MNIVIHIGIKSMRMKSFFYWLFFLAVFAIPVWECIIGDCSRLMVYTLIMSSLWGGNYLMSKLRK